VDLFDATKVRGSVIVEGILRRAREEALTEQNQLSLNNLGRSSAAVRQIGAIGLSRLREMSAALCQLFVETLGPELNQNLALQFIQDQLNSALSVFRTLVNQQVRNLPGSSDFGFLADAEHIVRDAPAELQVTAAGSRRGVAASPVLAGSASDTDTNFVRDENLRKIAEINLAEAAKCLAGGAHNACVVMCGSSLEAILLDALLLNRSAAEASPGAPKVLLEKWELVDLIRVAVTNKIVRGATEPLTEWLRDHRNLVHPGRVLRLGTEIGREEAQIAFGIVQLVCKERRSA
jgi:hypothetical protein